MSESQINQTLRNLPSVNDILDSEAVSQVISIHPRTLVVEAARNALSDLRKNLLQTGENGKGREELFGETIKAFEKHLELLSKYNFRRVINATGVVIHTNLGRSLLSGEMAQRVAQLASGYSNLEFDLETGKRGSRYSHVEKLLTRLTGAEAAVVVNNNAAAVFLCLKTMAGSRQVVVSRGQLVEIGGSFRIPDIMKESGAVLVEVGTTNKTHPKDFEEAICEETALLLKVHTSNFRMVGFTREVSLEEMVAIGRAHGIPVMEDLGSGMLVDLDPMGGQVEPTVQQALGTGADVITFSGDKLLGGPQAGVILGSKIFIDKVKKNPLLRMVRIDKMTLAALEATLKLYEEPETVFEKIPTLRMLHRPLNELEEAARHLADTIQKQFVQRPEVLSVEVIDGTSQVGGGSMPLAVPATRLVALKAAGCSADEIAARLRDGDPAVVGRILDDRFVIDPRTLLDGDVEDLVERLGEVI